MAEETKKTEKEGKVKAFLKKKERIHLILSLLVPTVIHGVYDYCLLSGYKIMSFSNKL